MVHTRGPGKFGLMSNFCSKVLVHDPEFDENVHCEHVRQFRRPCRGLSTWKGASREKITHMACRDGRQYFSRSSLGENRATKVREVFRSKVSLLGFYFEISIDPLGTLLWWRDLKLFHFKARPMVHTRGLEKLDLILHFCSKGLVYDAHFS